MGSNRTEMSHDFIFSFPRERYGLVECKYILLSPSFKKNANPFQKHLESVNKLQAISRSVS